MLTYVDVCRQGEVDLKGVVDLWLEVESSYAESRCIRQHTSAYVSTRQHIPIPKRVSRRGAAMQAAAAITGIPPRATAMFVTKSPSDCMRQHTSAYVRLRPHSSAYVSTASRRVQLLCSSPSPPATAYVRLRPHTYVRIRQHSIPPRATTM
jgi:hypothetical protein